MNRIIKTVFGPAKIAKGQYSNGRTAIQLNSTDGEPIGKLTVNLPEYTDLNENEIIVKTWSENYGIAADCLKSGLFEDTGKRIPTGFVEAQVWKFA